MKLKDFVDLRPYVYHLTDESNVQRILDVNKLESTARLAQQANIPSISTFLRTRRIGHREISGNGLIAKLRDQDPLFQKIVIKNLEGGWTFEDFVFSLNSRVFLWATEKDLKTHYGRYEKLGEFPKIFQFNTRDLFEANEHEPEFCRLNSGAPRCSSYYEEGAPPRGPKTFLKASEYQHVPSTVREVTFVEFCYLPKSFKVANHPEEQYQTIT